MQRLAVGHQRDDSWEARRRGRGAFCSSGWPSGPGPRSAASRGRASKTIRNVASVPSTARRSPPLTVSGWRPVYAGGVSVTLNVREGQRVADRDPRRPARRRTGHHPVDERLANLLQRGRPLRRRAACGRCERHRQPGGSSGALGRPGLEHDPGRCRPFNSTAIGRLSPWSTGHIARRDGDRGVRPVDQQQPSQGGPPLGVDERRGERSPAPAIAANTATAQSRRRGMIDIQRQRLGLNLRLLGECGDQARERPPRSGSAPRGGPRTGRRCGSAGQAGETALRSRPPFGAGSTSAAARPPCTRTPRAQAPPQRRARFPAPSGEARIQ